MLRAGAGLGGLLLINLGMLGYSSLNRLAPAYLLADDWLKRDRFVFVGWSGVVLFPCAYLAVGGWLGGTAFVTSLFTHGLASSYREGCNVLTVAPARSRRRRLEARRAALLSAPPAVGTVGLVGVGTVGLGPGGRGAAGWKAEPKAQPKAGGHARAEGCVRGWAGSLLRRFLLRAAESSYKGVLPLTAAACRALFARPAQRGRQLAGIHSGMQDLVGVHLVRDSLAGAR